MGALLHERPDAARHLYTRCCTDSKTGPGGNVRTPHVHSPQPPCAGIAIPPPRAHSVCLIQIIPTFPVDAPTPEETGSGGRSVHEGLISDGCWFHLSLL